MKKLLSWKNILIAALAVALIYFVACRHTVPPAAPPVKTTTAEQAAIVLHDSTMSKKESDSITKIIKSLQGEARSADVDRGNVATQNLQLQKEMNDLLVQPVADTCKFLKESVIALNKRQAQLIANQSTACDKSVNAQKAIVTQKDQLLVSADTRYSRLRNNFDFSLRVQDSLRKETKSLKPRSSIGVGIITESAWTMPYKFDAGVYLYFRNKKGTQISAGVLTSQRVQATYSKTLFRF